MSFTALITAPELEQHFLGQDWIVVDCRFDLQNPAAGRAAYDAGHIPNAEFADLDTDLSDKTLRPDGLFRGRHPLPAPEDFLDTLRRWGVNHDSQVVAYDAQGGIFAARLWWMLRWVGHPAAAVLDGGLAAWTARGLPLSSEQPVHARGNIGLRHSLAETVSTADLMVNLGRPLRTVLDARSPDRFRGENETLDPVGGHIPGAKNRFFKDNLQEDGSFKPAEQLRSEFNALISTAGTAVMQCGSGVTACHNLLAMEAAGLHGAALYPGSWSEWCADPARPVATGA